MENCGFSVNFLVLFVKMVSADLDSLADVVFLIEGTAINGAYINDIKSNYIIPTLEYFSQVFTAPAPLFSFPDTPLTPLVVFLFPVDRG